MPVQEAGTSGCRPNFGMPWGGVSPGSVAADRAIKPQLCAAAGIEHYLRIELGRPGPSSVAYRAQRGRYVEVVSSAPGQPMHLADPFPVELDLAALAAATRPPE